MITVLNGPYCNVVLKLHTLDSSIIDANLDGQVGVPHTIHRTEIKRNSPFLLIFKTECSCNDLAFQEMQLH